MLQSCRRRLLAWLHLAVEALRAEFPAHEVLRGFTAFDVSQRAAKHDTEQRQTDAETCVNALADLFDVDAAGLLEEMRDHAPIAQHIAQTLAVSSAQAWGEAVRRTQQRAGTRERHDVANLRPVLSA
jgi:hypothetical protein